MSITYYSNKEEFEVGDIVMWLQHGSPTSHYYKVYAIDYLAGKIKLQTLDGLVLNSSWFNKSDFAFER